MGTLPLPPTSKSPPFHLPSSVSSHTPPPICSVVVDSSLPLPSHPPFLNIYALSAFTLPSSPPPPTANQQLAATPSRNSTPSSNLKILQWNVGGLSSLRRAELITFLSNIQYDVILLQETHLSATKKFQIPGYSTLCTDRTFGRQGPVSFGAHNTGGGVLALIHSDLAFSPVFVSSLSSRSPTQTSCVLKFFFPNTLPYNFLNLYSPPIRSTLLLSELQKGPLGWLPIIYCWASPLSWYWRSQHPPGCPLLFPLLSRSCQGLYHLWPPWSFPQSLVVPGSRICSAGETKGRSEAHRSEDHHLRYIDASCSAFSVISRAKSAT